MNVLLLVVDLHREGCRSLKEKRQRRKGCSERWGEGGRVAACASNDQDGVPQGQWSFVIAGSNWGQVQQIQAKLEEDLRQSLEAVITSNQQERLIENADPEPANQTTSRCRVCSC